MTTRWDAARARSRELPRKYKHVKPVGDDSLNYLARGVDGLYQLSHPASEYGDMSCVCGMRMCCCDGNGLRVTKHECGCFEASAADAERFWGGMNEGNRTEFAVGKRRYLVTPVGSWLAACDACIARSERSRLIPFACEVDGCGYPAPATKSEYDALNGEPHMCAACKADELERPAQLETCAAATYGHTADGVPILYYSIVHRGQAHVYFGDDGKPKAVYTGLLKRSQMLKLRTSRPIEMTRGAQFTKTPEVHGLAEMQAMQAVVDENHARMRA